MVSIRRVGCRPARRSTIHPIGQPTDHRYRVRVPVQAHRPFTQLVGVLFGAATMTSSVHRIKPGLEVSGKPGEAQVHAYRGPAMTMSSCSRYDGVAASYRPSVMCLQPCLHVLARGTISVSRSRPRGRRRRCRRPRPRLRAPGPLPAGRPPAALAPPPETGGTESARAPDRKPPARSSSTVSLTVSSTDPSATTTVSAPSSRVQVDQPVDRATQRGLEFVGK